MNKEDTIRRAFKAVTGFDDYNKFNIELILGDEKNKLPNGFEDNTLYGFNVRLQTKDPVTPILGGKQNDKKLQGKSVQDLFNTIKPELTILKVFENCSDREIEFSYTGGKNVKSGKVKLTLKNNEDETSIINNLKQEGSFLDIHKKEMFPDSSDMYYWISRENEEKNGENGTQPTFLSNILIISSEEKNITFVKEHKIHFLRFLLKLQAAYSLILSEQVETTAVRAAIAQVMARNMSHNFGSHVLSQLVGDHVYEHLTDETVLALKKYNPDGTDKLFDDIIEKKDQTEDKKSKNHQLQYFFQYLKSRMDYLSEVTFGIPNLLTTKMMYGNVIKELDQVRILLNYISGISEFRYNFKLMYNNETLNDKKDIGVAFPSDVLGCHAFYNIIENIIRNTAKHAGKNAKYAGKKNDKTITFTIHFKDIKECGEIEGVEELYCVEIDNGVQEDGIDDIIYGKKDENEKTVVKGLIDHLNDSVLDEHHNLRNHSLGLLEMEASAAFLRQIDLPDIESDNYTVDKDNHYYHEKRLNIIKPFKTKEGHLGYRFFVQKSKEFLFVVKEKYKLIDKGTEKQLLNIGVQFISEKDFFKNIEAEKSFAHQFLLYDENVSVDEINNIYKSDCKTLLPLRKLQFNNRDWTNLSGYWANLKPDTKKTEETKQEEEPIKILQKLKEWAWKKYCGNIADGLTADSICVKGQASTKKYQVVLIDHGNSYNKEWSSIKDSSEVIEGWIENMSSRTNGKLPQFEVLSKTGTCKEAIGNYLSKLDSRRKDNDYLRIELFEAYHNKVVVIDERVQKFATENYEGSNSSISCMKLHESTNVYIPRSQSDDSNNPVIPLDPNDFGEYTTKLKNYIDDNIKNSFLLIHYGILERMYRRDENAITQQLEEWAAKAKRVVVTSGRGAHSLNLPNSVCFVNLSSVLYAFNEYRNKYIINYLLNQARRKRNE
jgi:hypothetical protein